MKANELRIGNLVYDTKGDVNIINLEAMTYICKESLNQVKPIPLTDEWLLKFGFEKDGTWFTKSGFGISIDNLKWQMKGYIATFDKCLYVHQLQNLYFALTGKELTFKG
jgi:hypothetical protein